MITKATTTRTLAVRWRRSTKGNLVHEFGDRCMTVFRHRTGRYHWVLATPNPSAGHDLRHSTPFRTEEEAREDAERELTDGEE